MTAYEKGLIACGQKSCFANFADGKCACLNDTDFHGKPCPFYKTPEQNREDILAAKAYNKAHGIREVEYK